jgi:hypothetical protein
MTNRFIDNGGPVIEIPRLELIYWGDAWNQGPTPSAVQIAAAVQNILTGPYMTNLVS